MIEETPFLTVAISTQAEQYSSYVMCTKFWIELLILLSTPQRNLYKIWTEINTCVRILIVSMWICEVR